MKLAFYYHIPLSSSNNQLSVPGYLGVFLDELAKNVEALYLVMHEASGVEIGEADYQLKGQNIKFISLGRKTAPWHRTFYPGSVLKKVLKEIEMCEATLVRSPSPLAPAFKRFIKRKKVFFMVVGDYQEGAKQIEKRGLKNFLLNAYFRYSDRQFRSFFPSTDIFVNSPQLFEKYKSETKSITLIKTTTLKDEDFFKKADLGLHNPVRILYTGRFDLTKGLRELIEAMGQLRNNKYDVHLNLVGWETSKNKPIENQLKQMANELGITENITFHGKKKIGDELNEMYRTNDIYILPSYHEGFPRTIWEAMANSIPVIATNVGGIPIFLEDKKHAILIRPKQVTDLSNAIQFLIQNEEFRYSLVKNGYQLAKENTIENQTKILIKHISEII